MRYWRYEILEIRDIGDMRYWRYEILELRDIGESRYWRCDIGYTRYCSCGTSFIRDTCVTWDMWDIALHPEYLYLDSVSISDRTKLDIVTLLYGNDHSEDGGGMSPLYIIFHCIIIFLNYNDYNSFE